jgi:hypothetical protein
MDLSCLWKVDPTLETLNMRNMHKPISLIFVIPFFTFAACQRDGSPPDKKPEPLSENSAPRSSKEVAADAYAGLLKAEVQADDADLDTTGVRQTAREAGAEFSRQATPEERSAMSKFSVNLSVTHSRLVSARAERSIRENIKVAKASGRKYRDRVTKPLEISDEKLQDEILRLDREYNALLAATWKEIQKP